MSAFRPIAPLSTNEQQDELSSQSEQATHPAGTNQSLSIAKARKRKAPAHVSQNACTNCKKARAKCDGEEPAACTRCISRSIADSCHYEVHVKTAKEELIRRIKDLEGRNAALKGSVEAKDRWIGSVLQILRDDNGIVSLDQLKQAQLNRDLVSALSKPPLPTKLDSGSSGVSSRRASDVNMAGTDDDESLSRWTSAIADEAVVHHLMALYFAWVHPIHMLFSERHFMSSFHRGTDKYCTSAMVNAMCALGCAYWVDPDGGEAERRKLLNQFYQRAREDVESEKHMSANTSVTYSILFLIEMSRGEARSAASHLRVAVESLRAVNRQNWTEEAFEITSWGIHTLNTTWSAFSYQKPPDPLSTRAAVFKHVEPDGPDAVWRDYRTATSQLDSERQGHAISTAKEFAKLNQIIFETMIVFCGRRGRVTAEHVLDLYRRFLVWRNSLPEPLTELDVNNPLPHVLALHIQYTVAILQLFAPLLKGGNFTPMAHNHIRSITTHSAMEGLSLYQKYRAVYSNRYAHPLQNFCLAHLGDVLLQHGEPSDMQNILIFCLDSFREALPGFTYIGPLAAMFCESVVARGHELPSGINRYFNGRSWRSFSREEKLDCCDRLTYEQPIEMLVERLDPEIGSTFEQEWKSFIESHGETGSDREEDTAIAENQRASGSPRAMQIQALMNP